MNKLTITCLSLLLAVFVTARTTYIPTYTGYIQIAMGTDSIYAESEDIGLGLVSQDKSIRISICHEEVDEVKVKTIKRLKRAASWASVAVAFSAASAGLNATGRDGSSAIRYVNSLQTMHYSANLAQFASINAQAAQKLIIDFVIENLSDKEIAVAEMNRGRVWYILPRHSIKLEAANPDVALLRISNSDPFDQAIKYATVGAGSYLTKVSLDYEDDDYWTYPHYETKMDTTLWTEVTKKVGYIVKSKDTFHETIMGPDAYKTFKKSLKK